MIAKKPTVAIILFAVIIIVGLLVSRGHFKTNITSNNNNQAATTKTATPTPPPAAKDIVSPIGQAGSRITKKFFGTYVTPQNSPVSPEKFTGFHTGLDFETFAAEKDSDVNINVICAGKLLRKGRATGYGGYAVQSCTINGQAVTVVYGHLRASSIKPSTGAELKAGDSLAVLGTGYSTETDGERKHLHLSIHIGSGVNIKGYVQNKSELSGWMDPKIVLGL